MKNRIYGIALLAVVAVSIGAACSSSNAPSGSDGTPGAALTCDSGDVIARCVLSPVPGCIEYGADWTMGAAQNDCTLNGDSVGGETSAFMTGTSCAHTGAGLTGSCLALSSGHIERYYIYEDINGTVKASCVDQGGTWCPITAAGTDSGADSSATTANNPDSAADAESATEDSATEAGTHDAGVDAESDAADAAKDAATELDSSADAAHHDAALEASADAASDSSMAADVASDGATETDAEIDADAAGDSSTSDGESPDSSN